MPRKLSVLLCEDMDEFSSTFVQQQGRYFDVDICNDVHCLRGYLRDLDKNGRLPDLVLLDLFSRRDDVLDDEKFRTKRHEVDTDVREICDLLKNTGENARTILSAHGIDYLKDIRKDFPEYKLPILLYSRLGPYILQPEEAAAVDEYNSEFLLKWIGHDEQRKKIERFFYKWCSQHHPIALEISRKLSTLPRSLAEAVAIPLKTGQFEAAIRQGFIRLNKFLQDSLNCTRDGKSLFNHMKQELPKRGRRRAGEENEQFYSRANAVCNLYYSIFVLKRNYFAHNSKEEDWCEADMCLSAYNLIWREVEELIGHSA